MAQLNITLNQDEILQLLANDRDSAFSKLLQDNLNGILRAECSKPNRMSVLRSVQAAAMGSVTVP